MNFGDLTVTFSVPHKNTTIMLLFCGLLLGLGIAYGEMGQVEYSGIMNRIILESRNNWQAPLEVASPEIDSTEHGVTPGVRQTSCPCGRANRAKARIVGGKEYSQFEYPFLAALSYSNKPLRPHCGSVIISSKHLLTAAHCTEKAVGGIGLFVTIAEHDKGRTPGAYTIPVEKIIQHEKYNTITLHHDITLLSLKNPLLMTGAVGTACLPHPGLDVTGKYVRAIGWGATKFQGPTTSRPRKVDLKVIDTLTCHNLWPDNVIKEPKSQICTMSREKTTCQGDSGGPVVWLDPETNRYTIVGLVSAGPPCIDVKPSVHTSVADYLPWIMKGIQETSPGMKLCTKV